MPPVSRFPLPTGMLRIAILPAGITLASVTTLLALPASAQITPDDTLGNERSQITPNVLIRGDLGDRIDGGATRGSNLFHSFAEFNVNDGQRVYFANPSGIATILGRVTGSDISDILGTLGVDGNANLFLLNPNGFVFGPNARLDLRGSFVASTADRFVFLDGTQFSATDPQAPPLLTMNVPIGIQYGTPQGDVTNQAQLQVETAQTLTLHGATVFHEGGLTAPGGGVQVLGDRLALLDNSSIDVSAPDGGGTVQIGGDYQGQGTLPTALRTYVAPTATIRADALASGNGGQIIVWADETTGFYGSISAQGGPTGGNGGFAEVSGLQNLIFQGTADLSAPYGSLGTLLLDPTNITIADGAAGADDVQLGAGQILEGQGLGLDFTISEVALEALAGNANILLQATDNITLNDLTDNELTLAPGIGFISFQADFNEDGVGDFTMNDVNDTIRTNGRSIAISGAALTLGSIDTSPPATLTQTFNLVFNPGQTGLIPDQTITTGPLFFTLPIPVTATAGTISDVNVRFSASHTWTNDLITTLISPGGIRQELFSQVGENGDNFQDTVLDDGASVNMSDAIAPFNGTFRPTGTGGLAVFNDQPLTPGSTWTLQVEDVAVGDSGQVYQPGDIAPWGPALGTQLIVTTGAASTGPAGDITLTATTGDITAQNLIASNLENDGGEVFLDAVGGITVGTINANSSNGIGGDINLIAGGDIALTASEITSNSRNDGSGYSTISLESSGGSVLLDSTQISAVNSLTGANGPFSGYAGDIWITAPVAINVNNGSVLSADGNYGRIFMGTGYFLNAEPASISITDSTLRTTNQIINGAQDSGIIRIQATNAVTLGNSQLRTDSIGAGGGEVNGTITILTTANNGTLTLQNNTLLNSSTTGNDASGDINLTSSLITMDQSRVVTRAEENSTGAGGNIFLAGALTMRNGTLLDASTGGEGRGGNVSLNASGAAISLDNSQVNVETRAEGAGGNLTVAAGSVSLTNNSRFNASVQGSGAGGAIAITTSNPYDPITNTFPLLLNNSVISTAVESTGTGQGGSIEVTSAAIALQEGARIQAQTRGSSDAGDITIQATDQVDISGRNAFGLLSGILTSSANSTSGEGGDLTVTVSNGDLRLRDRGFLSAGTQSSSPGGNISVDVNALELTTGGQILTSATGAGAAGTITVRATAGISMDGEGTPITVVDAFSGEILGTFTFSAIQNPFQAAVGTVASYATAIRPTTQANGFDYYTIDVNQGNSQGIFDLDNTTFDTELFLFNRSTGELLATNDDAFNTVEPGETPNVLDSYIDYRFNAPGQYVLGVGRYDSYAQGNRLAGASPLQGDTYALRVSLQNQGSDNFDPEGLNPNSGLSSGLFAEASGAGAIGTIHLNTPTLTVTNGARVSVTATETATPPAIAPPGGGGIRVDASTITLSGQSASTPNTVSGLFAGTEGAADAGTIQMTPYANDADLSINFADNARISTSTVGSGDGGDITVEAPTTIRLSGEGSIFAEAQRRGNAGNVQMTAPTVELVNNASISTTTRSNNLADPTRQGQGGDIRLNLNTLDLGRGTTLLAETSGTGRAGSITVEALEAAPLTLTLGDGARISASTTGAGAGGNITIGDLNAPIVPIDITIQGPGSIEAISTGVAGGNSPESGGDLAITARRNIWIGDRTQISVSGDRQAGSGNMNLQASNITLENNALLSANTGSNSVGGDITLNVRRNLRVLNSLISNSAANGGQAGNLTIQGIEPGIPTERVLLRGGLATGELGGLEIRSTGSSRRGSAGTLTVRANELTFRGRAGVVGTSEAGRGANITLEALDDFVIEDSEIATTTQTGTAGNLTIRSRNSIQLRRTNDPTVRRAGLFAEARTAGGNAGSLEIETNRFSIDNAQATVSAQGEGTAGSITVRANDVQLTNQGEITATTENGRSGNINVLDAQTINLSGQSQISASTQGGQAGSINIQMQPGGDIILNDAQISSASTAGGQAGSLDIGATDQLTLNNGASLTVRSTGQGRSGDLSVQARQVSLQGATITAASENGPGGSLTMQVQNALALNANSSISASTLSGRGGSVTLEAEEVNLDGNSNIAVSSVRGQGGSISLEADAVNLNGDSSIAASTVSGQGGNLRLTAPEITLDGDSRIAAEADPNPQGEGGTAGNVALNTERLRVLNDSAISVSSEDGVAGNLTIQTTRLYMDRGQLTARAGQGSQGSIFIDVPAERDALIELYNRSLISAQATGSADGGNVDIRIPNGFVISRLPDNSDILASAEQGQGGRISIEALSIFGLRERDPVTPFSDINASSQFSSSGTIVLSTLGIDPTRGLAELPNSTVDATQLVIARCPSASQTSGELGEFIISGRGGVPSTPDDLVSQQVLTPGLIRLDGPSEPTAESAAIAPPEPPPLVEAQGWIHGPEGTVMLVAGDAGAIAHPGMEAVDCDHSP